MTSISLKWLPHGEGLKTPEYETQQSAGVDLRAAIDEEVVIKPNERVLIPCGFAMALPANFEAQVRPRSGLALKHGLTVLNTPGTIDADYRGEVKVILVNLGSENFTIERGMRIAQMVIAKHEQAELDIRASLDETERGAGGFGSTGT